MAKDFLPFSLPDIGEMEIEEVVQSLRSGWLTTGPKTKAFEEFFSKYLGDGIETIAVNSGTAGLHLALEAIGIKALDEVITTAYTFTATAEVIRYLGADPIFVDIEPEGFNINPDAIEEAVTKKTRAVIPVHFAGEACRINKILKVAERHNLAVIEDAAHSLPTRKNGKLVGNLPSDATVFSFYATKPIATGEGGMVATKRPGIVKRCRVMRLHGIDRDAFNRYQSERPAWYYEVVAPGFKYNMTDIAASIGLAQLRRISNFHRRRMEIAKLYDQAFSDLPLDCPPRPEKFEDHAWHLYVLRLRLEEIKLTRNEFIEKMAEKGIGTSVHFIPLHLHPYWRDRYGFKAEDFPVAFDCYKRAVSLPIYSKMNQSDVNRVIESVRSILK